MMYALVDCNNFYASCERVFNPNLQFSPIAILSNNDGCVISRSDEAKALGLPMGAPIFKWENFCKQNNIEILSSNYPLYGDMSSRTMEILKQFTPDIEVYSIDEAFLKLNILDDYNAYGIQMRQRILKWLGLPTSVGIAPTKALSKIANKIARKYPKKTKGVYVIDNENKRIKALKWTKLNDVWGIGSRLEKRLQAKGCKTAYDFIQLPDALILKEFSIVEWRLKKDLQGIPTLKLEEVKNKQAIATTRSFETTYTDLNAIKERISTFAARCAEKLRAQQSSCHSMVILLRSDRFDTSGKQHNVSRCVSFSYPTNSTLTLCNAAVKTIETMFKAGVKYKRAGVIVTGLISNTNKQLNFFEKEDTKQLHLMRAIDDLNFKYNGYKVKLGNQDLKRTWKMKQERLSPKYTTNFDEIIIVK